MFILTLMVLKCNYSIDIVQPSVTGSDQVFNVHLV